MIADTQTVLWSLGGETRRLSKRARAALSDPTAETVVSAVSIWEIAIKRSLGKLRAPENLIEELELNGVRLLPITARHAEAVEHLDWHHRDPFDRLLIAQAQFEKLPVITNDKAFREYPIEVVW